MKKADYDAGRGDLNLEENVNLRLRDLLERKKAQDLEGASERTRGHATRVLRPRLDELREMVVYGLSMREITDLLAEGGVQVNYHSLRGFLQRHMPREYAEYLVAKKPGAGDPHFGKEIPAEVLERDTPAEFRQTNEEVATDPAGSGKQREEAPASRTRIDPTAIGKSFDQMKAEAEEEARLLAQRYEDKF